MVNEIVIKQTCTLCNGDGYLSATKAEWKDYLSWLDDPTEDKANSHDNFPIFLKDLPNHSSAGFFKDRVTVPCTRCNGRKSVVKLLTLDELKALLG